MNVLIADDDASTRLLLELYCRSEAFAPVLVESGMAALARFARGDIDAVVTDVKMGDISGEVVLAEVKRRSPETPVLIMTAHGSIDEAVRFLKGGADDYIAKPVTQEVFAHRLRALLERVALAREVRQLRATMQQSGETLIIGNTAAIGNLLRRLPMTAQTDATVLVNGESGTGKELVAARIHELSKRKHKRFVAVNCGALSDTLLESELFGYKRGAFTDAHRDTPGLVEEAEGGTLFLDEIGEISPAVQVKLLRFLQSKEYKALGSPRPQRADVRIVAATNRDLKQMVGDGTFREDLYYRLNIVPITVPPLRDRKADIPLLASYFLNNFRRQYGKDVRGFTAEALARLTAHNWPGNVRELENRVQQLVVLATEPIIHSIDGPEHGLSPMETVPTGTFKEEKKKLLEAFEREFVRRTLDRAEGNMAEAARLAGLDRKNFWLLAKRHNVRALRGSPPA
jgi:two-component system response regulator GlrR